MASQIQLCNLAIVRLGGNPITALTDGTTEANLCNILFSQIADEVMVEGSWTSTIRRASLAATTDTPAFEYTYSYQLPVDPFCLKVLNIDENLPGTIDYRIEDDRLLTDSTSVKIRYIARLTATGDWDTLLARAFVARLASELAYPLTGNAAKAQAEMQRYNQFLLEGLAINGQQGSKEIISSSDLIEVR